MTSEKIEIGDVNWAYRYDYFSEFVEKFVPDAAKELAKAISERPDKGGIAIKRKGTLRTQMFMWDRARDFVSLAGVTSGELEEIRWLSDIEVLYFTQRMRDRAGKRMFRDAADKFKKWCRGYTRLPHEDHEIAAVSEERGYLALFCQQWKFRGICAIFTRKSWMLAKNANLDSAVQFPSFSIAGQWIMDAKTFEGLFWRELEMLESDDENRLPVLACLAFQRDGLLILRCGRDEGD